MGNLNIDLKDKKTLYAFIMTLVILLAAYTVYTYVWDPFVVEKESLESSCRLLRTN